ncbi:uncharacterized protein LOC143428241 [Xylocopa sonorina]|uniref:uncharacterized protein LOC143428241 n=1 Tax=Xylocopa sonorina TaxID=1818115 RepID=UPI00403B3896
MYYSIFKCSIFFTVLTTTCSRSIRYEESQAIESSTINSDNTTLPNLPVIHDKSDSKLSAKRSLVIFVPPTEEEEDAKRNSQKTKRCKTAGTILKTKNTENANSNGEQPEYILGQRHKVRHGSTKKPAAKPVIRKVLSPMERARNATFLDEDLINSLRDQLRPGHPKVGATRKNFSPKTSIIDDDNFVCYCREKNNPSSKHKADRNMVPKPQSLTPTKSKPNRKLDNKRIPINRKQGPNPVHGKLPRRPILSDKLPPLQPENSHYAPNYLPNNMYPTFPQRETVPYIPYVYHADPPLSVAPNIDGKEIPTKIDIPSNSLGNRPDSIVGQRAPIDQQRNFNKNQQPVGQGPCPPNNMIGKSLTQPSTLQKTIPATTSRTFTKEDAPSNDEEGPGTFANNLQSTSAEVPNVQATNPNTDARSSTDFDNEDTNEYETTDSGTVDYSDVQEFITTSKAYTDETEHEVSTSYDDFHVTVPMNTDTKEDQDSGFNSQSQSNVPAENSIEPEEVELHTETKNLDDANDSDQGNEDEEDAVVGKSNPYPNQEGSADNDSNQTFESNMGDTREVEGDYEFKEAIPIEETTVFILENSAWPDESGVPGIDDKDGQSNGEFSAEDYAIESPETEDNAGPLESDYERENFESDETGEKIDGEEGEERNFINTDNERVGAERVTGIQTENEDDVPSSVEPTLKSSTIDDAEGIKDPSNQSLPFCDNTLLQKSIKTVINNFAADDDSSEANDNANEEIVGVSKGEDLLAEIVEIPNLKGILSMPPIEHTILEKVKDFLARATGITRKRFEDAWATNVIRNNLRNIMSAAPISKTELPPMAVEERQFKDGKWMTHVVTLEPSSAEENRVPTDLERLQATVKSILRDPAISLQAARNPTVQNMIVQSIRGTFKPENGINGEAFDDAIIQSTLNNELSIMEAENDEAVTTESLLESTTNFDVSDIDMNKLLDIARSEAGLDDKKGSESGTLEGTVSTTLKSSDTGLVGAMKDSESSEYLNENTVVPIMETNQNDVQIQEENETSEATKDVEMDAYESTTLNVEEIQKLPEYNSASAKTWPNVAATARNHDKSWATEMEDNASVEHSSPTIDPTENADGIDGDEAESAEKLVGMEHARSTTELYSNGISSVQDLTYLGKITVENENKTDDVLSLRDSELFYIGDGVKLPLEIRKLNDGSYALSISRKVCEHLLNKECPCCVPLKGNVVRTVKRSLGTKNADKTIERNKRQSISNRESKKSILPNEKRRYDLADDSIQISSMPVETFARRYNLSLNLEKVQTPWNFDARGKIDGRNKKETNVDVNLRNLLSVHAVSENGKPEITIAKDRRINNNPYEGGDATSYEHRTEKERRLERYRYQRNINENVNERVEIIKNVLNWLRDMILSTTTKK